MTLKFTKEQIAKALRANKGFISYAAKYLNCDVSTIHNYIKRYPELSEVLKEQRESTLDHVELSLLKKIDKGDTVAIIFYLKTQGRSRGYGQEMNLDNLADVTIEFKKREAKD